MILEKFFRNQMTLNILVTPGDIKDQQESLNSKDTKDQALRGEQGIPVVVRFKSCSNLVA